MSKENMNNQKQNKNYIMFTKKVSRFFIAFVIICFVLNLVIPSREFSEDENRSLSTFPSFSLARVFSGQWFKDFNSYYSDQIVGRNFAMSLNSWRNTMGGKPESGGVYIGKAGYLFDKSKKVDVKAENKQVKVINDFVKRHENLSFYMLILPDSTSVNKKKLPWKAPFEDQGNKIIDFERKISNKVVKLDGISPLKKAKEKDMQLYYKTDHHWTSKAAYEVFKSTASKMGINSEKDEFIPYLVTEDFQGTLTSKSGNKSSKDKIYVYGNKKKDVEYIVNYPESEKKTTKKSPTMFQKHQLEGKDKYLVFFGGNYPKVDIRTTSTSKKVLLVLKDSYANCYLQFLYPYYNRIIIIDPRYYYDNIRTTIVNAGVTDVMFLYSGNTFLGDTNIVDTLETDVAKKKM